jgi:hypothetical protein
MPALGATYQLRELPFETIGDVGRYGLELQISARAATQQPAQERAPTGCGQPRSLPLAADGFTGIILEAEVPGAAREEAAWAEVASASTLAAVRAAPH